MAPVAAAFPIIPLIDPFLKSPPTTTAAKNKQETTPKRFEAVYAVIRDHLLADFRKHSMPEEAVEYYQKIMDYNVPGGKLSRGLSVVDSVAILKGRDLTESEYFKAAILGWIVEWPQAYSHVSGDIRDASITRRGLPCWYRAEGVGIKAINDAFILQGGIFQIIRIHFRNEPFYVDLVDLLHEVLYQTEMRQPVELSAPPEDGRVDLSKFSLGRYRTTTLYNNAMYSFYLPVALALLLCGFPIEKSESSPDSDYYKIALDILLPLGEYSQIQDDYFDYHAGTPEKIVKVGVDSDIMNNRCSWCINTALAHANPTQRAVLDANYGRKDPEAEAHVKQIFREVGVDAYYAQYEAEAYARINALIDAVPEVKSPCGEGVLCRAVFRTFLEKIQIHKRTK